MESKKFSPRRVCVRTHSSKLPWKKQIENYLEWSPVGTKNVSPVLQHWV
jgi:hypothetical protein